MRDWHCEPLLRLTNYSIPPRAMVAMLEAGYFMAVSAAYGVDKLQWGMELIVSASYLSLRTLHEHNNRANTD
jgi:hypothetical protein